MLGNERETYTCIDLLKFFFACCVMLIHTGISRKITCGFYLQQMVFRLAVPFFFVCSGYFFAITKYTKKDLTKRLKKLWIPYVFLGIFYILLQFYMDQMPLTFIFDQMFRLSLLSVATSVVWFIGSLIFSMILITHIQSNKKAIIFSIFISLLLYLVGLSFTTYSFLPQNFFFTELSSYLSTTFYHNRNPLFSGYLFFSLGYVIGKFYRDYKINKWGVVLVPSVILGTYLESRFLFDNLSKTIEYDFLVMHIPMIIVLFLIWKNMKSSTTSTLIFRKMSTIIFYTHMAIIYFYRYLIENNFLVSFGTESKKFDLIVVVTTIILSYTISKLQIIYRKEVVK